MLSLYSASPADASADACGLREGKGMEGMIAHRRGGACCLAIAVGLLLPFAMSSASAEQSPASAEQPATAIASAPVAPGWRSLDAGFEAAEIPVSTDGREVDRIFLARVDPAKFRFVLRNDPAGRTLKSWLNDLGAVMVINGGYFDQAGAPVTPTIGGGVRLGPPAYDARHGAFVATGGTARLHDLRKDDWRQALSGAETALVSFPLLLAADGGNTTAPSAKNASRSFAAQDKAGRIVFGTTRAASFTLPGLAAFLKSSTLDLVLALNLDGGPFACQAIALGGVERNFCGTREAGVRDDGANGALGGGTGSHRRLPIALGVVKR
jgi:hypothetical protein